MVVAIYKEITNMNVFSWTVNIKKILIRVYIIWYQLSGSVILQMDKILIHGFRKFVTRVCISYTCDKGYMCDIGYVCAIRYVYMLQELNLET